MEILETAPSTTPVTTYRDMKMEVSWEGARVGVGVGGDVGVGAGVGVFALLKTAHESS